MAVSDPTGWMRHGDIELRRRHLLSWTRLLVDGLGHGFRASNPIECISMLGTTWHHELGTFAPRSAQILINGFATWQRPRPLLVRQIRHGTTTDGTYTIVYEPPKLQLRWDGRDVSEADLWPEGDCQSG